MTAIDEAYLRLTPESARMMERANTSMARGLTRTLSWFAPYPVVFERGAGAHVWDIDGNAYIDLFSNGLSLMHGHGDPEIDAALRQALARGTAWPGASDAQVQFAELLCERLSSAGQVRFANTGTEATMLAVKLARHATGRQLIIKAWDAYHGSYDDLEAGLQGQGEVKGRVALARFGELSSYEELLQRHAGQVAAIIVEPVQYTGLVTAPPDGFLAELRVLAREAGVLFILDDCLMFRLAEGGSAQRFGIERPDITCLGKWIGGGLPVGAIGASTELMSIFDPLTEGFVYHGGSFNGNLLGCVAGQIAVRRLDAGEIARIDGYGARMRSELERAGSEAGVALRTSGVGSAFGLYVLDGTGEIDWPATSQLHKAAVTHGVYYGTGGEFGLPTALSDEDVEDALSRLRSAIEDVAVAAATEPV